MTTKTPATVITGFLGAGKTTMIRHILENAEGRRIALLINEFGELGVDGDILRGCGIEACGEEGIVELSNGCICCTVAEEFAPAIQSMLELDNKPDHILIETSGLAIPQPLIRAFNWPEIGSRITVDGVVAVVDGPAAAGGQFAEDLEAVQRQRQEDENLDHHSPLEELFEDQIACADLVVVNKSDVLGPKETRQLRSKLESEVRAGVKVVSASHGRVDKRALLGLGMAAESGMSERSEIHHVHGDDNGEEADHGHDEFESFAIDLPELADPQRFADGVRLAMSRHGVLRAKGFAAVSGKPMRLVVQAVGPRVDTYFDRRFSDGEARGTRLVVIGETGLDQTAIRAALRDAVN